MTVETDKKISIYGMIMGQSPSVFLSKWTFFKRNISIQKHEFILFFFDVKGENAKFDGIKGWFGSFIAEKETWFQ